jgi:serine protease Do
MSVAPGEPAERAGLRPGDVILELNGERVEDPNSFRNRIASTPPGSTVKLSVARDGQVRQVDVKLDELKPEAAKAGRRAPQ